MRRALVPFLSLALPACEGWLSPPPAPPLPSAVEPVPAPDPLPDLVVITLDTTRADHLGLYGYVRDTTPTLDALAKEAQVFERLVVPMATTLPTHTSLFTGTWPEEHGVLANVQHGGRKFIASDRLVPFAAWASSIGYTTAAFTSAAPLDGESGIQTGFTTFDPPRGAERRGAETVDHALTWLSAAEGPILLWVHLYDPHNPWTPDPAHLERFKGPDSNVDAWMAVRGFDKVAKRPSGEVVRARQAANLYDAELRTMDDAVARLLDGLRARGRWDRTALVVMGDHGEGLNQHGEPGHGLVWGEQLHAPLLIKAPGLPPGRSNALLSAADVLPTLLGRVDLPEEARFLSLTSGVDVLAPGFTERPVLSQTSDRQLSLGKARTYALTGRESKCVWTEGEAPVRYDLVADPHELRPGSGATCLPEVQAEVDRQRRRGADLGAGQTEAMSPERLRELCALGYLVEGCPTP